MPQILKIGMIRCWTCNEQEQTTAVNLTNILGHNGSQTTLDAISLCGFLAHTFADDEASQTAQRLFSEYNKTQVFLTISNPFLTQMRKVFSSSEPFLTGQHVLGLNSETLSAFTTAAFDDATSTDRAHPHQEAMFFMAFTVIGLKCAFHDLRVLPVKFNNIFNFRL